MKKTIKFINEHPIQVVFGSLILIAIIVICLQS